jgi:hypothetical protein
VSSTQCLHDAVVEDLLWNSLDGNVLKQRVKDGSLEDLLPQMGKLAGCRPAPKNFHFSNLHSYPNVSDPYSFDLEATLI